ncbi:MAG: hypothetical protein ACP5RN_09815 [Armatimonadota bacterium]
MASYRRAGIAGFCWAHPDGRVHLFRTAPLPHDISGFWFPEGKRPNVVPLHYFVLGGPTGTINPKIKYPKHGFKALFVSHGNPLVTEFSSLMKRAIDNLDLFVQIGESLPVFKPAFSHLPEEGQRLPLCIVTPRSKWRVHSTPSNNPLLLNINRKPVVEINPPDAVERGIQAFARATSQVRAHRSGRVTARRPGARRQIPIAILSVGGNRFAVAVRRVVGQTQGAVPCSLGIGRGRPLWLLFLQDTVSPIANYEPLCAKVEQFEQPSPSQRWCWCSSRPRCGTAGCLRGGILPARWWVSPTATR